VASAHPAVQLSVVTRHDQMALAGHVAPAEPEHARAPVPGTKQCRKAIGAGYLRSRGTRATPMRVRAHEGLAESLPCSLPPPAWPG